MNKIKEHKSWRTTHQTQKSKYLVKEDLILNMSVSGYSINRCNVIVINKYHIHHLIKEGEVVVHVDYQVQLPWLEGGLWCLTQLSWQLVLLVKETGVPRKNHQPAASHWQTLSHNVVSSTPCLRAIWTQRVFVRLIV
jgi:hypothetical protein